MPLLAPASIIMGILLSSHMISYSFLVPWIFAFITFSGSLGSNLRSLHLSIKQPLPIFMILFLLHIVMPLWAGAVGHIAFSGDVFTISGLILSMVIPTGITSLLWVSIHKGNIALTFSTVLIDTVLSPFILPLMLSLLVGKSIEMEVWNMMYSLIGMVVVPSLLAMVLNQMTHGQVERTLSPMLAPFSKIGLAIVIMINGAVVAPYLTNINLKLVLIAIVVFCVAATGYIISWIAGRFIKCNEEDVIALTFTGGIRNISAGSVIALTYFPPPVAVPVVIGMLFQQVLASSFGYLLKRFYTNDINIGNITTVKKEG